MCPYISLERVYCSRSCSLVTHASKCGRAISWTTRPTICWALLFVPAHSGEKIPRERDSSTHTPDTNVRRANTSGTFCPSHYWLHWLSQHFSRVSQTLPWPLSAFHKLIAGGESGMLSTLLCDGNLFDTGMLLTYVWSNFSFCKLLRTFTDCATRNL